MYIPLFYLFMTLVLLVLIGGAKAFGRSKSGSEACLNVVLTFVAVCILLITLSVIGFLSEY